MGKSFQASSHMVVRNVLVRNWKQAVRISLSNLVPLYKCIGDVASRKKIWDTSLTRLIPPTYCPLVIRTHRVTNWAAFRSTTQRLTGGTRNLTNAIFTALHLSTKVVTIPVKHLTPDLKYLNARAAREAVQHVARRTNAPEDLITCTHETQCRI